MRIPFRGYAADCTITGELELDADRLKDLLDRGTPLVIFRATLEDLDGGSQVCVPRLELDRSDVLAAQAEEPRGPAQRRIRTVRHRTSATFGPYTVTGDLHDRPGAPPMSGFHSGRPLVSFTDASIAFTRAGRAVTLRADTLLVNARLVDWVGGAVGDPTYAASLGGAQPEAG